MDAVLCASPPHQLLWRHAKPCKWPLSHHERKRRHSKRTQVTFSCYLRRSCWSEQRSWKQKRRIAWNKQTNKQTKHATTRCQSGLRRCSWICGCPCWWCGLLVFPMYLWLPSWANPKVHRLVGLQWWQVVLAKDKDYWAAPREDGFGIKCLCWRNFLDPIQF